MKLLINLKFVLNSHEFNSVEFVKLVANVSRVLVSVSELSEQVLVFVVWSVLMSELSEQLLVFIVWSNDDVFIVEPRKVARVTRS